MIHMKKSNFTESRIVKILKEAAAGVAVEEFSQQHGFRKTSFFKWKATDGGMDASALKWLKQMSVKLNLERPVLKEMVEKIVRPEQRRDIANFAIERRTWLE